MCDSVEKVQLFSALQRYAVVGYHDIIDVCSGVARSRVSKTGVSSCKERKTLSSLTLFDVPLCERWFA